MTETTTRDDEILQYIRETVLEYGYPPTVREIARAVGLNSPATVHAHLRRLEERGLIRRHGSRTRALEVTDGTVPRSAVIPLLGHVTAGQPIFAEENIEEMLSMPEGLSARGHLFALRVHGESMINAGILNGDIIVVREQNDAENGEIVVAMIGDEATVKRIYYEEDRVRLQPENSTMDPIYADEVTVLGRVIALYRMF